MKRLLLGMAMLLFAAGAAAQDFRITHGPYLCDMTDDGVTVVWTTSAPALSWVEVAPADGRSFYAEEHPRYYETVAGRRQARKTLHTVRLRGLEPGTAYCYRIFSREVREWPHYDNVAYGAVASSNVFRRKPYTFRTFPESGAECRFLVLNDIHGQADLMGKLLGAAEFDRTGFVAFNGDMSSSVESREQLFADYIDTAVECFASETPILFNRGNHDTRGVHADLLPEYFPKGEGTFYALRRYGDVCLLTLDCGEDKPDSDIEYAGLADYDAYRLEQREWLAEALRSEAFRTAATRIVLLHVPPDERTLAREPPHQGALPAAAQRRGYRPDDLRPRAPLFVPRGRRGGCTLPDPCQRQQKLRMLRGRTGEDLPADHRSRRRSPAHPQNRDERQSLKTALKP